MRSVRLKSCWRQKPVLTQKLEFEYCDKSNWVTILENFGELEFDPLTERENYSFYPLLQIQTVRLRYCSKI